ncbi:MAG: type II toxin-antitoxin system VapC family toxin [Capsulimonadales bacterium]|nr:type II toxin-antitoxin system VapC family toxin [Capsulimonadales bacterium]
MYLLDTDHMSVLRYGGAEALRLTLRLSTVLDNEIVTCIVVYEEQMRGWLERSARAQTGTGYIPSYKALTNNLAIYCTINLLPFDKEAGDRFDDLKHAKINIGTQDLKIAAIALVNDAILLTRNTRHFSKVPNLKFEDWTM